MSARPITTIAIVQVAIVVLCYFLLCAVLKIQGYPSEWLRWKPLTVFLRAYGMWMLVVPALWVILCVLAESKWPAQIDYPIILIYGIFVALMILAVFVTAAVDSHTRPIIMRVATPPAKVAKRFQAVEVPPPPPAEPAHE